MLSRHKVVLLLLKVCYRLEFHRSRSKMIDSASSIEFKDISLIVNSRLYDTSTVRQPSCSTMARSHWRKFSDLKDCFNRSRDQDRGIEDRLMSV